MRSLTLALAAALAAHQAQAAQFLTLYKFCSQAGCADGAHPTSALINVKDALYGTTVAGGAQGLGTVFSLGPDRIESVLHSFSGQPNDGSNGGSYGYSYIAQLAGGLVALGGVLYGLTPSGGPSDDGTVYSITTQGVEAVLHSFDGTDGTDGATPYGGLISAGGALYGTTSVGGGPKPFDVGDGTVFAITPQGQETVLHAFGGSGVGAIPLVGLVNVAGTFYGTTSAGGGLGSVYSITPQGVFNIIHTFTGINEGCYPSGPLVAVGGTLFGTTRQCGSFGLGTVYSLTPQGVQTVLYNFGTRAGDGNLPLAGVIYSAGVFYATTTVGGNDPLCNYGVGCGTVFSITPQGALTTLHVFHAQDGGLPLAPLVAIKGTLFGTTSNGGNSSHDDHGGAGTVFQIQP